MKSLSPSFNDMRRMVAQLDIVDCHEHMAGREKRDDIISFICSFYVENDVKSVLGAFAGGSAGAACFAR